MKGKELTRTDENALSQVERAPQETTYQPDVDIIENGQDVTVIADMPGVDEKSAEIGLENDILTISGKIAPAHAGGTSPAYQEFRQEGRFVRTFSIGNQIDRDHVKATVRDGVLRVVLPKVQNAQVRRITVKSG